MGQSGSFRMEKIKSEQRAPWEGEREIFKRAGLVMFYSLFKCSLVWYPMAYLSLKAFIEYFQRVRQWEGWMQREIR